MTRPGTGIGLKILKLRGTRTVTGLTGRPVPVPSSYSGQDRLDRGPGLTSSEPVRP